MEIGCTRSYILEAMIENANQTWQNLGAPLPDDRSCHNCLAKWDGIYNVMSQISMCHGCGCPGAKSISQTGKTYEYNGFTGTYQDWIDGH